MQTPEQKIEVYDEILHIRPGDLEALTYKADAAMEINEYNWALSMCNRVLEVDDTNGPALYQRACAFARLGIEDQAIEDLQRAIDASPSIKDLIASESDFESLQGNQRFETMLEQYADEASGAEITR